MILLLLNIILLWLVFNTTHDTSVTKHNIAMVCVTTHDISVSKNYRANWFKNNISDFVQKYQLNMEKPIITLFPGSRSQELNKHFNLFVDAALKIKNEGVAFMPIFLA